MQGKEESGMKGAMSAAREELSAGWGRKRRAGRKRTLRRTLRETFEKDVEEDAEEDVEE